MSSYRQGSDRERKDIYEVSKIRSFLLGIFLVGVTIFGLHTYTINRQSEMTYNKNATTTENFIEKPILIATSSLVLDKEAYDKKMLQLANLPPVKVVTFSTTTGTTTSFIPATSSSVWPVKSVYPNYGALLPFNRIVAYYGNFYSKQMGVLGEYPVTEMLAKLRTEVKIWEQADPGTPVIPAIHYIVAVAQGSAGSDGDYLARMPSSQIDKAIELAKEVNGIVFLDIQIGHSNVLQEILAIQKYLALPQVHLGLDPEFSMKNGKKPGSVIGTLDASEINKAAELLATIVRDSNLPPKILLLHRFTENMITNTQAIRPLPEVQVIIDMDGWGSPELKKATYSHIITEEPVQFSGIKLFYKNDLRSPSTRMLTPEEILKLQPQPSYIQYQ